jgi:orotate phosphoribosyltransferase
MFDQDKFNAFVIEHNVVGFFEEPIKLKSGRQSHWYVNWRTAGSDAYLLDCLTDYVVQFTENLLKNGALESKPSCFYGVPEGATKLGVLTQYKWAKQSPDFSVGSHILPMGRGKIKEHGVPKDRYFVGQPTGPTIVLELWIS